MNETYYKLLYTYTNILCVWNCRMHLHLCVFQHEPQEKIQSHWAWLVLCDRWDLGSTWELLFLEITSWAISKILKVIKIILFSDSEQTVLMSCCERGTTSVCHSMHATWITSCTLNSNQVPYRYKSNPSPLHRFSSVQMKKIPDVYNIHQKICIY